MEWFEHKDGGWQKHDPTTYEVRRISFSFPQPSYALAAILVYVTMLPALVLSKAQALLVRLRNAVPRGYKLGRNDANNCYEYFKDEDYKGSMVFMGKDEEERHMRRGTKYLWLWKWVPFCTPELKEAELRDYSYVTTRAVSTFARWNRGVKTLHLTGCSKLSTAAVDAIGTYCDALEHLSLALCKLTGRKHSFPFPPLYSPRTMSDPADALACSPARLDRATRCSEAALGKRQRPDRYVLVYYQCYIRPL